MKILLFSDSHNNVSNMENVIRACQADTSLVVHLGDMVSDSQRIKEIFPDIPMICIRGNNDFFSSDGEMEYISSFEGVNCLFTHGHQYNVKLGIAGISVRARGLKSNLVAFGHTHIPHKEKRGNTLFINPGTIGQGSFFTFAIVNLQGSAIKSADILQYNQVTGEIDFLRGIR